MKIETDIDYIKQTVSGLKIDADELKEAHEDFIKKADDRYASKLTEKIMYALIGTIVTIVIIAIVNQVLKV